MENLFDSRRETKMKNILYNFKVTNKNKKTFFFLFFKVVLISTPNSALHFFFILQTQHYLTRLHAWENCASSSFELDN